MSSTHTHTQTIPTPTINNRFVCNMLCCAYTPLENPYGMLLWFRFHLTSWLTSASAVNGWRSIFVVSIFSYCACYILIGWLYMQTDDWIISGCQSWFQFAGEPNTKNEISGHAITIFIWRSSSSIRCFFLMKIHILIFELIVANKM